jgi:hypothetical protein
MMTIALRRAKCRRVACRDWKGGPTGSLATASTQSCTGLHFAFGAYFMPSTLRTESAMDGWFHCSFTNVFDVKENVRVTPVTSYDQRCVVLPFHSIVDVPCPSRCNHA